MDAAQFQRLHNLEGAPDPFPSLNDPAPAPTPASASAPALDAEEAFPSLAPSAAANRPAAAWGASAGPRIRPVPPPAFTTESFTLTAIDLSTAGRDGKPATLGEIMKQVMAKHKVKIEASSNQLARQTTFNLKSESKKELDKAKRMLLALLSPTVSLVVNAPASTVAFIIGPKGATLKTIRDQTNVRVDIPRRETLASNGYANGNGRSGAATPSGDGDEEEEPTVPVTITGPQPLAEEAQELIKQIIASKTSKTTQRVRDIPVHIIPFVKARRQLFQNAAQGADVQLGLNSSERELTAAGDREAVIRVIETVKSTIASVSTSITCVKFSLPKRQHRLLVNKAVDEIMAESKCAVVVPSPEDPSEEVQVWGRPEDAGVGIAAAMSKANSKFIHEFPLPGPITLSRQLLTYIIRTDYSGKLATANPGVDVYVPNLKSTASTLNIDLVGDKPNVDGAVRQVSGLVGKMINAVKEVQADWLVHKFIAAKNAKKIKQFHDTHNVILFFPPESEEHSSILLVYDPLSPNATLNTTEKMNKLDEVEKEVVKFVSETADVKSQTISVEKKWHDAVKGPGGTTLNAIIGEEKALAIKVGADVGDSTTEDVILVRGASADVDRAVKEIQEIVENAKNDLILSGYSTEFDIDREYVGRIVGSQGGGVNKLREQLGVKVDFSDDGDDFKDAKKKKIATGKSHVKIVGRKENAEEAKRRILAQVEKLADETQETLKIPNQYHSSLIGQNGKYVIRLEERYSVRIIFPREAAEGGEGRTREPLKPDEVLVKGGRKGVAQAKTELLEAVEFEKESNNVIKFTVVARAVPRILGKGGVRINEIKAETDAQIDVDKSVEDSGVVQITCRGSKKAIAAAKALIQEIADQVNEETISTIKVDARFHRTLIGPGGSGLKDIINRCGGPSDTKAQASLVRFPRQGEEPNDEVRLRGDAALVKKLQAEIERLVGELRDRVIIGVEVPASQHRALIGRGGQKLIDFQSKFNVQVQYPGSHSYHSAGKPENEDELASCASENLVKISGPRANVQKAVDEMKNIAKPAAPESVTDTISVPLKYQHAVSQQGNFFRNLRSSYHVTVDQSAMPTKSAVPTKPTNGSAAPAARIDDVGEAPAAEVQWEVTTNYTDAEEGESTWTLKGRDAASVERAKKAVQDAIAKAEAMSHVGFLTLPDRGSFPRIVGAKGANIVRLHAETGADITVSRENNTIVIMGSEQSIQDAKDAILKITNEPSGGRRGGGNGAYRGRGNDRD
ncbi:hypothetical protein K488DRAFT_86037 [Vararia minispora EC-137]|uniref:Uncharacterized protein n=1 Tax=Vararia minispora EC-137 TaxID=1314806 RepID=A0ACB8QKK0_9AGAM|nr:hypothetical protein K488DRAFT_86037 [Vararia minispora EC-137]